MLAELSPMLNALVMNIPNQMKFAVLDVETTGFGKTDRILEIAIVIVADGHKVQEWETLINPERDISNSEIHGITAGDVSLAPTFAEVIDEISALLNDNILVAHNITFDARMLSQEFARVERVIDIGIGFCTLKATGLSLERACEAFNIQNKDAHRALTDTRATVELLMKMEVDSDAVAPMKISGIKDRQPARILCRDEPLGNDELAGMQTLRKKIPDFDDTGFSSSQLSYADALYGVMSDFVITESETGYLADWAQAVGISDEERSEIHQDYLHQLVLASNRDGFISPSEKKAIEKAAKALNIRPPLFLAPVQEKVEIVSGIRVCFTGSAKNRDGGLLTKEELASIAVNKGLVPVESVTKRTCELVVAADESSMSGKAQKARKYGIRVISVETFLEL